MPPALLPSSGFDKHPNRNIARTPLHASQTPKRKPTSQTGRYPTQLLLGDGARTLIVGGYTNGEQGIPSPAIEVYNSFTNELRTLYDVSALGVWDGRVEVVDGEGWGKRGALCASARGVNVRVPTWTHKQHPPCNDHDTAKTHTQTYENTVINTQHSTTATNAQVPVLVELGGYNLYPVVEQLPWAAPGVEAGSFVIVVFGGTAGQVRRGLACCC